MLAVDLRDYHRAQAPLEVSLWGQVVAWIRRLALVSYIRVYCCSLLLHLGKEKDIYLFIYFCSQTRNVLAMGCHPTYGLARTYPPHCHLDAACFCTVCTRLGQSLLHLDMLI